MNWISHDILKLEPSVTFGKTISAEGRKEWINPIHTPQVKSWLK